jgi:hypothetical protein
VLALAVAIVAVRQNWLAYRGSAALDYYQFWLVGQAAREVRDPYSAEARRALGEAGYRAAQDEGSPGQRLVAEHRRVLDTTASPFLYAVFRALSTSDYEIDYALYRILSVACTAIAILLVSSLCGWPVPAAFLVLAVVLVVAPPFASDCAVGNVNQIQLAGLSVLLVLAGPPGRRWMAPASGVMAALLVLFKPNVALAEALLVCGMVMHRRFRFVALHFAGAATGAVAVFAASSALFGTPGIWKSWLAALADLDRGPPLPMSLGNLSFVSSLPGAVRAGLVLALVAATLAAMWVGRERRDDLRTVAAAAGAGLCITLLGAALCWEHYFVLLTPFVLVFLRREAGRRVFAAGAAAAILLWLLPAVTTPTHPALVAGELAAGTAILLVACWSVLGRPPPDAA